MALIKDGDVIEDIFVTVDDGSPLPSAGAIVSLKRFLAEKASLLARNAPLGVRLKSDESPEPLNGEVHKLAVVALEFPKFRDGRAFSWARLLRGRLGYRGEVRAVGDFLYDQIAFMHRVGFDAFDVRENVTLDDFRRALREMSNVYQPSADGRKTIRELRAQGAVRPAA